MDLMSFFRLFFDYIGSLLEVLRVEVSIGRFSVMYLDLIYVFLVIGFVVTLFWKGAKA